MTPTGARLHRYSLARLGVVAKKVVGRAGFELDEKGTPAERDESRARWFAPGALVADHAMVHRTVPPPHAGVLLQFLHDPRADLRPILMLENLVAARARENQWGRTS